MLVEIVGKRYEEKLITTSLKVAEVFEKEHKNVLQSIRFCSFLTIALFLLPALQGTERDSLSLLRTIAEYEALPAKWIETVFPCL